MKFWREPLVHFVALGALLFVIFGLVGKTSALDANHRIVVTPGMIENLQVSFARAEGHPADAKTLAELVDGYVREEILCREARNLGLDRDDTVVRTILVKRMEYLAVDENAAAAPTDATLEEFLHTHARDFQDANGRLPALAGIRESVVSAWRVQARQEAIAKSYQSLRSHYRVTVPAAGSPP